MTGKATRHRWGELGIDPAGLELIEDPVWVFDLDIRRVLWANQAGIYFWQAESLLELRSRDMGSLSDVASARLAEYAERFARGEVFESTWTLYPKGLAVTARLRLQNFPTRNGRAAMLVHMIDSLGHSWAPGTEFDTPDELRQARDELARAEARFRAFAQAGSDWLWETDREHRFVYMSTQVQNYVGRRTEWFVGKTRREVAEAFDVDTNAEGVAEAWQQHEADLEARRSFRDFEYVFTSVAGTKGYCSVSGDPVFDERGRFLGYRGVARDITPRIEAENRLRETERERDVALAANAVSNQLIATLSHELRTPLNAILGFSEIMSNELLGAMSNPSYSTYSRDIFDSAQHLLGVVDDLLNLSRVDIGDAALDIERFSVHELFQDVARMMEPLVAARELGIEIELEDTACEVEADKRTMRQVLLNLLSNAAKFSSPGATITIGGTCKESAAFEMFVRDTGCGIDPEQLPYVFEPFRTADPHVAREAGGTGLGLWICRRIVNAHGGEIEIESSRESGTLVKVHLPPGTCSFEDAVNPANVRIDTVG